MVFLWVSMYKIQVLENPTIPQRVNHIVHYDFRKPVLQYRVKLRSNNIDELLERIVDAAKEQDFCYFEFKDIAGQEHSYPISAGWKQWETFGDDKEEVLYLDFMVQDNDR